jgi:hypothetical protein
MKFVNIKDSRGMALAVNPEHIILMHVDRNGFVITLTNDRRITTTMFRNVEEAVKYCMTTSVDTSKVGDLK